MPKDIGYYHNASGTKHPSPKKMKAAQKSGNPFAKAVKAAGVKRAGKGK